MGTPTASQRRVSGACWKRLEHRDRRLQPLLTEERGVDVQSQPPLADCLASVTACTSLGCHDCEWSATGESVEKKRSHASDRHLAAAPHRWKHCSNTEQTPRRESPPRAA